MAGFEDAVQELSRVPITQFVAERKRLADELKAGGDAKAAKQLLARKRPTISAWAVNQLYWHARDAFDVLLATAETLRKGDLKASGAHREAIAKLRVRASTMLADAGHAPNEATLRRVATTLSAIAVTGGFDPDPPGALAEDRDPPGFAAFGIASGGDAEASGAAAAAPVKPAATEKKPAAPEPQDELAKARAKRERDQQEARAKAEREARERETSEATDEDASDEDAADEGVSDEAEDGEVEDGGADGSVAAVESASDRREREKRERERAKAEKFAALVEKKKEEVEEKRRELAERERAKADKAREAEAAAQRAADMAEKKREEAEKKRIAAERHRLEAALRTAKGEVTDRERTVKQLEKQLASAVKDVERAQEIADDLAARLAELDD